MAKTFYIWYDPTDPAWKGPVRAFIRGFDPEKPRATLSKRCEDRETAESWVAKQRHTLDEGTWQDPKKHRRLLRYYGAQWWEIKSATLRDRTLRNYERWYTKHVLVRFGDEPIGDITANDIELWMARKSREICATGRPYSPKSVNEMLNVLQGVLERAVRDEAVRKNVAVGLQLDVPDYEGVRITMEQIIDFIDCVVVRGRGGDLQAMYRTMVWVLVFTGLRSGEVCGLHICDIDWQTGDAKVIRTYGTEGGYDGIPFGHGEGPVKTKAGKREVHIPEFVLEELQAHIEARGLDLTSGEPLFLNKDGNQVKGENFHRKIIRPAAERAGLSKGFRTHDVRGSHISLLLELGANIKAITAEVGHSKGEVTLSKYARTLPGSMAKLSGLIEQSRQATLEARVQSKIVPFAPSAGRKMVERSSENPGQTRTNRS